MNLQDIEYLLEPHALEIYGAFHPLAEDVPGNVRTLVMLGPREPGFWGHFTTSPEYQDKLADPMDRWSLRVINSIATKLNSRAFFPFGGPPYQPFIRWAQESGRAHVSPVGLLVHDVAGLWVSYRGALGLSERIDLPVAPPSPCSTCEKQPCRSKCPVDALTSESYDVPACKADLDRAENDCMSKGCAVRRACPVSRAYGRTEAQSAFHMEAFR